MTFYLFFSDENEYDFICIGAGSAGEKTNACVDNYLNLTLGGSMTAKYERVMLINGNARIMVFGIHDGVAENVHELDNLFLFCNYSAYSYSPRRRCISIGKVFLSATFEKRTIDFINLLPRCWSRCCYYSCSSYSIEVATTASKNCIAYAGWYKANTKMIGLEKLFS